VQVSNTTKELGVSCTVVHCCLTVHIGHSWNCDCLHCRTRLSTSSANNRPSLNISSPEFVPRGQVVSTEQYADTSSRKHVFVSGKSLPVSTLNSRTTPVVSSAANAFIYSAGDGTVYSEYLPERFANVAIGHHQQSQALSFTAQHRQDASTQTVKVDVVNACVGNSSVLLVDACTNTPHCDETVGVQQAPSSSQANPMNTTMQNDRGNIRWAECWQSPARSVDNDKKCSHHFSDADNSYLTPASSVTNFTASATAGRESSGVHVEDFSEECDRGAESSPVSVHQVHGMCECSFSNCPFASSALSSSMQRNVVPEQSTDASSSFLASGHEHGHETMQVSVVSSL